MFTLPFNQKITNLFLFVALLLILNPGFSGANAGTGKFIVDQANTTLINANYRNFHHYAPMGQEFRPNRGKLNVVELWIEDASCSVENPSGGQAQVRILQANIYGQILGTSNVFSFPNCFNGIARFTFSELVHLTPGRQYVIEALYVSGDSALARGSEGGSTYEGGRAILSGIPDPEKDLWFKEGFIWPLP